MTGIRGLANRIMTGDAPGAKATVMAQAIAGVPDMHPVASAAVAASAALVVAIEQITGPYGGPQAGVTYAGFHDGEVKGR